jgi:hypothetical protein
MVLGSPDLTNWASFGTVTFKSLSGLAHHAGQMVTVGAGGAIIRSQLTPPPTPVNIAGFSQSSGRNLWLFSGESVQRLFLENSADLENWTQGRCLSSLTATAR